MYAMDGSGNINKNETFTKKFTFRNDVTPPVINGTSAKYIELKNVSSFVAPTLTATDAYDNGKGLTVTPVANASEVSSIKNATAPGTYQITYTAQDSSGNVATPVKVTVYVSDYTALQNAYNKALTLIQSDYSDNGAWTRFLTAKSAANQILNQKVSAQNGIDDATKRLNDLMAELAGKLTPFTKDLSEYKNLVKTDYTADSWNNSKIESLIKEAEAATLKSVYDQKLASLKTAKASLVKASLSDIDAKLQDIKNKVGQLDQSVYTPESWKKVQDAIAAAEEAKKTGLRSKYGPAVDAININSLALITMTSVNKTTPATTETYLNTINGIEFKIETNVKLENSDTKTITINNLTNLPLTQVKAEGPNNGKYTYTLKISDGVSLANVKQGAISYTINLSKTVKTIESGAVKTKTLTSAISGSDAKRIIDTVAPSIKFADTFKTYLDKDNSGNITISKYIGDAIDNTITNTASDVIVTDTNKKESNGVIIATNNFNINKVGKYEVTYKAVDKAGNESNTIKKTIVVNDYTKTIEVKSNEYDKTDVKFTWGESLNLENIKLTETKISGASREVTLQQLVNEKIATVNTTELSTAGTGRNVVITYKAKENGTVVDKTVRFTIDVEKAETVVPDASKLPETSYNATYGNLLKTIKLPAGWTFDAITNKGETDPEPTVGNATDANGREFAVTYTAKDANHKDVTDKVKIVVAKANPTVPSVETKTAIYGDKLGDITLPTGFKWENTETSVGEVGTRTFKATYTPGDTANYNIIKNIDITVTVSAKAITVKIQDAADDYGVTLDLTKFSCDTVQGINLSDLGITYVVKDGNNVVSAGTKLSAKDYVVTATASNKNYNVTFTPGTYKINKIDVVKDTDFEVETPTFTYDGLPKKWSVKVNNTELKDTDFTLTYNGGNDLPVNAGTYSVNVKFNGTTNYKEKTFENVGTLTINKVQIAEEHFDVVKTVYTEEVTGSGIEFSKDNIIIKLPNGPTKDDITIIYERKDGKIFEEAPSEKGEYAIKIKVAGTETSNYIGTPGDNTIRPGEEDVYLKIVSKSVESNKITVTTETKQYTYDPNEERTIAKNEIKVTIDGKDLKYGKDYTIGSIQYKKGNDITNTAKNAGMYAIKFNVTLIDYIIKGGSDTFEKTLNNIIEIAQIEAPGLPTGLTATFGQTLADVALGTGWSFDDVATTPVGTVLGTNLFNVTYTPEDTVNYAGAKGTVEIKVNPAHIPNADIPAVNERIELIYADGQKLNAIENKLNGWNFKTSADKDIVAGNAGSEHTVKIVYTKGSNYIDEEKDITVTVGKATPSYTVPTGLTSTYGKTLADVNLPAGFTWQDEETTLVGNAGDRIFKVKYNKPGETAGSTDPNYAEVTDIEVTITVGKATPSYTVPTGLTSTYGKTLAEVTLPDGFAWEEADTTKVGNAGTQTHTVKFTPEDTDNYNVVTNISVIIEVAKADPEYTTPTGLTATYGETLANVTLPNGFKWVKKVTENDTVTWVEDNGASVGNAGENTFYVTYTPADTNNYNIIEGIEVKVTVSAASVPADDTLKDSLTVTMPENLVYNKEPKSATVTSTIEGLGEIAVKYYQNGTEVEAINAGTYDIKITIAPSTNYAGTPNGTVIDLGQTMTIIPSPITIQIHNKTSQYGKPIEELTFTRTAGTKYDGDILGVTLTAEQELTTETPVGDYKIIGTAKNTNYGVTFVNKDDETKNYGIYTITKTDPSYTVPSGLTAEYGETLADVELPTADNGTFTWVEGTDTSVGNAGENTFHVKFTPNDKVNYNTIESIDVIITVTKANTEIPEESELPEKPTNPDDPENENYADYEATYGDLLSKYASTGDADKKLPAGWTFDDLDGKTAEEVAKIYVGSATDEDGNSPAIYEFAVTFKGDENHKDVRDKVTIKVNKANNAPELPTDAYEATYGDKLNDIELPEGWKFDPIKIDDAEVVDPDVGDATGEGTREFAVTYTPADPANYNEDTGKVYIKVARKDISDITEITDKTVDGLANISITDNQNLVYNGVAQEPVVTNKTEVTIDKTAVYSKFDEETGSYKTINAPIDVGEYKAVITVEASGNYKGEVGTKTVYYNITQRPITIIPVSQIDMTPAFTYGDTGIAVRQQTENFKSFNNTTAQITDGVDNGIGLIDGHSIEGIRLITPDLPDENGNFNAGKYDIKIDETANVTIVTREGDVIREVQDNYAITYMPLENGFEILQKSINELVWTNALELQTNYEYDGTPKGPIITPPGGLVLGRDVEAQITYVKGANWNSGDRLDEAINIGIYWVTVTVSAVEGGNYTQSGVINLTPDGERRFIISPAPVAVPDPLPTFTVVYGQTLADIMVIKTTGGAEPVKETLSEYRLVVDNVIKGKFELDSKKTQPTNIGTVGEGNGAEIFLTYTSLNSDGTVDNNYSPADCTARLVVTPATPIVQTVIEKSATYGDLLSGINLNDVIATMPGTTTQVPGTWSFDDITDENKGTLTVGDATQAGVPNAFAVTFTPTDNINYNTAKSTVHITVSKANQKITHTLSLVDAQNNTITNNTIKMTDTGIKIAFTPITLEAGIAPVFESSNDNVAIVDSNTLEVKPKGAGTATITATFEGNNNYKEATATINITVEKDELTEGSFIIDGQSTFTYNTSAHPIAIKPNGVTCDYVTPGATPTIYYKEKGSNANPTTTAPIDAGEYEITADIPESKNYSAKTGLLIGEMKINKAQITSIDNSFVTVTYNPTEVDADGTKWVKWTGSSIPLVNITTTEKKVDGNTLEAVDCIRYYTSDGLIVTGTPNDRLLHNGSYLAYLDVNGKNIETVVTSERGIYLGSYTIRDIEAPRFTNLPNETNEVTKADDSGAFDYDFYKVAEDTRDGNLTNNVIQTGTIPTLANGKFKKGDYTLTYTVFDLSGNRTERKLIVHIVEGLPEIGIYDNNKGIWNPIASTNNDIDVTYEKSIDIKWSTGATTTITHNGESKTYNEVPTNGYPLNKPGLYTISAKNAAGTTIIKIYINIPEEVKVLTPKYTFTDLATGSTESVKYYSPSTSVQFKMLNPESINSVTVTAYNNDTYGVKTFTRAAIEANGGIVDTFRCPEGATSIVRYSIDIEDYLGNHKYELIRFTQPAAIQNAE